MDKNRRKFLLGCFICIDILLISVFFLVRDVTLKNTLQNEVNALVELDFSSDSLEYSIKTKGRYAVVEKTIKSYFQVHSVNIQTIDEYKNDAILNDLTSISNYRVDGPYFADSLKYVSYYKNKFNVYVDELIAAANEGNVYDYINKFTDDEKKIEMYINIVNRNNLTDIVLEDKVYLLKKKEEYNNYFDSISNLLVFLSNNKDFYYIENDEIVFLNDEVRLNYENLLGQIKRI